MRVVTPLILAWLNTPDSQLARQQGCKRFPSFMFIKVVMMLGISLGIGVLPFGSMSVKAQAIACALIVPPHPLTAQGLATPYQLVSPCHEANPAESAFVQGAIFDPATGQISVYDPLVVDAGTSPAITPVPPVLHPNAVVALWFGFNGNTLTLQNKGTCIDGLNNSPFGQFAYCNAPFFFSQANQAIRNRMLFPPQLGFAKNGLTCPTTRDFSVVDMDQSDNVTTSYLAVVASGRTAQDTVANRATLTARGLAFNVLTNPSDNKLLVSFIDPALGCHPWMVPNLANAGLPTTALPLNELQAARHQGPPVALVPAGDPMVLVNGVPNLAKLNLYRIGVDQPVVTNLNQASTTKYCLNLLNVGAPRLFFNRPLMINQLSPDVAMANNLFAFLALRFNATWSAAGLNCTGLLGQPGHPKPSPFIVIFNNAGIAVDAIININHHHKHK